MDDPSDLPVLPFTTPKPVDMREALGRGVGRLTREEHLARADALMNGNRPSAALLANRWKGKTLVIVGGAPSLAGMVEELRASIAARRGQVCVMALNKTHDWLIEGEPKPGRRNRWLRAPIVPEFAMMLDPKPWCASYMTPHPKPIYIFGSTIDPTVWSRFDAAPQARTFWFYPIYDIQGDMPEGQCDTDEFLQKHKPSTIALLAGGSTVGLRAINVAMMLGFTEVELWGFDSVYAPGADLMEGVLVGGELYSYAKPHIENNGREFTIRSKHDGTKFTALSNEAMQRQVSEFDAIVREIEGLKLGQNPVIDRLNVWKAWVDGRPQHQGLHTRLKIRVAGDGAIPWMAWKDGAPHRVMEHVNPARMAAKYGRAAHWHYNFDCNLVLGASNAA